MYLVVQEKKMSLEVDFIEGLKKKVSLSLNSAALEKISLPGEGAKASPPALPGH